MQWYRIESAEELDALEPGYGGIPEPAACEERLVDLSTLDGGALALVPGLLFDRDGFRLGYGGGFYDRFLCTFPGTTMGVCYEKQMLASLSQLKVLEGHDVPVDMIVHECSGEMSCRNEL
jgi:5-formyltetrahydrofolate cyclo-ligase